MPAGRPSEYSEAIAEIICERIADGESLRNICDSEGMPAKGTIFRWLSKYKEFQDQYAYAKEVQAELMADEILEIADDGRNDWMEKMDREGQPTGAYMVNGEAVQRSRLRLDARKWLASKLKPKRYGEKLDLEHSGDVGLTVQIVRMGDGE